MSHDFGSLAPHHSDSLAIRGLGALTARCLGPVTPRRHTGSPRVSSSLLVPRRSTSARTSLTHHVSGSLTTRRSGSLTVHLSGLLTPRSSDPSLYTCSHFTLLLDFLLRLCCLHHLGHRVPSLSRKMVFTSVRTTHIVSEMSVECPTPFALTSSHYLNSVHGCSIEGGVSDSMFGHRYVVISLSSTRIQSSLPHTSHPRIHSLIRVYTSKLASSYETLLPSGIRNAPIAYFLSLFLPGLYHSCNLLTTFVYYHSSSELVTIDIVHFR